MSDVSTVYEFTLTAAKGASIGTLVKEAWRKARAFYGTDEFDLTVQVLGRSAQWEVACRASREMDVDAG